MVLTFFLTDVPDNAGTLVATTHRAGLTGANSRAPRLRQVLLADSGGAVLGAALGTGTVTNCVKGAAGIQAGGRTGLVSPVRRGCSRRPFSWRLRQPASPVRARRPPWCW